MTSTRHVQREEFRAGFFLWHDRLWELINLRNEVLSYQDGLFRWDIPAHDEETVREAVMNSVSHRDYRRPGSVMVRQWPGRLDIVSPGGFPDGVTEQTILSSEEPRNRRVAETLQRSGLIERSGQGADLIFRKTIESGKPLPDYSWSDGSKVWLTLRGELQSPELVRFFLAVFSRYKKVLETDGAPMRVRTALALINQGLDEVLSELESEFDPDTRWALAWFEQHQFDEGLYGEAEVLATAKALSISHLAEAGILHSRAGKVRLLRREEFPVDWDPSAIDRLTVWEVTQHLIRCLDQEGEKETANLKAKIGGMAEIARDLAYRLYTLCERKGWAEEAGYYNSLVVAWPAMRPPDLFQ